MIETQRLVLRRLILADRAALKVLLGDDEVMSSSDRGPLSGEEVHAWLRNEIHELKKTRVAGKLAIIRRSDSQFIGYCGLTLLPEIDGIADYSI
jgi:RimJ/RimL family protein N-acetyltransferase